MKRNRFTVIEYASFYAVRDNVSGAEAHMSDGVDSLFTPSGKAMTPGSEHFRRTWERSLNSSADETLEVYFPMQHRKENA